MLLRCARLGLLPLFFAACADAPRSVPPPSLGSQPPGLDTPPLTTSADPHAPPPLGARLGAPINGHFVHAVSCKVPEPSSQMAVWPVGKGLLGTCGISVNAAGVFYMAENGHVRLAPEVFKDLPIGRLDNGGHFSLYHVSGPDLEHVQATIGDMSTRTGLPQVFQKNGKQWQKTTGSPAPSENTEDPNCRDSCVKIDGHPLVESNGSGQFTYNDGHKGWTPARATVPDCNEPVHDFALLFMQRKELWAVGTACGKSAVLHATIASSITTAQSMALPAFHGFQGRLHPAGGRWIYEGGGGRILALFDGKTWSPLKSYTDEQNIEIHTIRGKTWIRRRNELHRIDGTKLTEVYVPDEQIKILSFSESGELRVWTGKGLYSLGPDTTWHLVPLPSGTEELQQLAPIGGRWAYQILAKDGDKLSRLFIEGASGMPLQIIDPRPAISPMAYVRPMDVVVDGAAAQDVGRPNGPQRGCELPFAMLYKLAKEAPKDYDFPATKEALASHPELKAARFSEVEAFGDRYLVAQFEGPQARKQLGDLVELVRKEVKGSTPQLLCADGLPNGLPTMRSVPMK